MSISNSKIEKTIQTDVLIIGAGPVGLFQVFQLGLLGIRAHIVDCLPMIGGQCSALYPDKQIYDIPATPQITGQELVNQLVKQIEPLKPTFHLNQWVQSLKVIPSGYEATTQTGLRFETKYVVIAGGVGAFVHKQLPLSDLSPFRSSFRSPNDQINPNSSVKQKAQVFNEFPDEPLEEDSHLIIYGANESAVRAALRASQLLAKRTSSQKTPNHGSICLVYRREQLEIDDSLKSQLESSLQSNSIQFKVGQITGLKLSEDERQITHLVITDSHGEDQNLRCDYLIECLGLSPKLGPISDWGIEMEKKNLKVNTENFETSAQGIYAVGDINTYAGKRKLILCGFHEATLAAYSIASRLMDGKTVPTEYTTASSRIHKILGV